MVRGRYENMVGKCRDCANFLCQLFLPVFFRKDVLGICLDLFIVGEMWGHVSKGMCGCDCWLFEQSSVCHVLENTTPALFSTLKLILILHISDKRWIPVLVVHSVSEAALFPCTSLTFNLKPTKTRLGRIRSNLGPLGSSQRLWTARVSSAIDDVAGNNACVEVLFEASLRQPRAGFLEFGPRLNHPVTCTLFANRSVAAASFFGAPELLCASAALVSHLVATLTFDFE